MKKLIFISALFIGAVAALSQCSKLDHPALYHPAKMDTILYKESGEDFANPDRGFYRVAETRTDPFEPLDLDQLKQWRTLQQADDGSYKVISSLVFRNIVLNGFNNQPLSAELLGKIDDDFTTARTAGMKLIVRFTYNVNPTPGNCPEGFICPPYGDASKAIILNHIAQLKPTLQKNADVISCMQMGFVGMWGENYYSDHFGDPSSNGQGQLLDKNWNDKSSVLKALLEALPADRMIQVRTPQMKQRYVFGAQAPVTTDGMKDADAFTQTDNSRIGFHNDCFLSSFDDYGTFEDYGNSSSPRASAVGTLRAYLMNDSKYTPVGGETCDDTYSPYNDCENAGQAQTEMRSMHYSFLNCAYNNDVNNDWATGGCMDDIKKNLGYRFVLRKSVFPSDPLTQGTTYHFNLTIDNVGYASPFNEYAVRIILRNKSGGKEYALPAETDARKWYPGTNEIKFTIPADSAVAKGTFALFLSVSDKFSTLAGRNEYAIRLANEHVWEEKTGYNNLGVDLVVK